MKVVTIGGATHDIFMHYKNLEVAYGENGVCYLLLPEGAKIEIDHLEHYSGGGATNSAVSFARLGNDVSVISKVGQDDFGTRILEELSAENVDVSHIVLGSDSTTALSCILPSPSGNRSILVHRGANVTLTDYDIPPGIFQGKDQVYVSALRGQAMALLPIIAYAAKKSGARVAINPGTGQLQAGADTLVHALKHCDVLILNAHEAQLLWESILGAEKKFEIPAFCKEIMARGPQTVVVTDGAQGVYAADKDALYFHPTIPTNVVSTVGAGDAFGSCFVAMLEHGIEHALRCGIVNSASVISYVGAKTGLLTLDELERRLATIEKSLLKCFSL